MADALGVLDVIIAGGVDGSNDLGVLQVAHIELLILGVEQVVGEPEVHGFQQLAAVELVPHHVEVEGGGLFDQLHRVGTLVVDPGGQKAVLAHLIAAAVGDGGVLQEKLCVRGQFFPFAGIHHLRRQGHPVGRDDKVGAVGLGRADHIFREIGLQKVVAVHELDVLAFGHLHAIVAGHGKPGIGLVDQGDAGVFAAELLADGKAAVCGAVVQHDDFDLFPGLRKDTFQTPGNTILHVIHRHDNADERIVHDKGSPIPSLFSIKIRSAVPESRGMRVLFIKWKLLIIESSDLYYHTLFACKKQAK